MKGKILMKVYIDFDDVLCETAKHFTKLAKELFGIDVPYREVQFFNLKKTFDLSDEQYEEMMIAGHLPENLLNYEETTGAADTINKWVDEHNLKRVPLYCVDKYGRETSKQDYAYNMTFDFAIEDSPSAFEHVMHFDNCKVAVFNRPWNIHEELPDDRFVRCEGWKEIDRLFEEYFKQQTDN